MFKANTLFVSCACSYILLTIAIAFYEPSVNVHVHLLFSFITVSIIQSWLYNNHYYFNVYHMPQPWNVWIFFFFYVPVIHAYSHTFIQCSYTINSYEQYYYNNQRAAILHLIVAMQKSSKINHNLNRCCKSGQRLWHYSNQLNNHLRSVYSCYRSCWLFK